MEQIDIKPYHMFCHRGSWYVINIEGMLAGSIDDATAAVLDKFASRPAVLKPYMEAQLKKLGLLSTCGEQTSKAKNLIQIEPVPVRNMSLFLTQSCNLKCVYCYGDVGKYGAGGNMDEKTAMQAVDWLLEQSGEIKKLHIAFFGGEPFLNFTLMKAVVEYAEKRVEEVEKKVKFHTTTNATLLDDEIIAFLKEHRISVTISLDGPKDIHDAQRPYANGEGSYDSTVPKIKKLLEVLPNIRGHAVIVGNTDPKPVKDALQEIGFVEVSISHASESLFKGDPDITKSARDTHFLLQSLEQEAETWIHLTKSRDSEALMILMARSGLYPALISLQHNIIRNYACGAGQGLVAVSSSGNVYLCHRFVGRDEYKLGSVFAKSLNRDQYQKSPVTSSEICSTCFARYYCAGGCKHDNAASCGSITTPPEDICQLSRRELELAATIVSRLDPEDQAFLAGQQILPLRPCPLDF